MRGLLFLLLLVLSIVPITVDMKSSGMDGGGEGLEACSCFSSRMHYGEVRGVSGKSIDPWWNTFFEYRRKVNITEVAGVTVNDFPVDFHIDFDPPAYYKSQYIHSIRVYDYSGNEVPIQIYNVTVYSYSDNLISEANIVMYVDLSAGYTYTYYVYWTDNEIEESVSYGKTVDFSSVSSGYVFSTDMYDVETNNDFGGKIYRVYIGGVDIIEGDQEYMDKSAHFSPIFNPRYSDATSGSVRVLALNGHYEGGISDNVNHGEPDIINDGPIFVEYSVTDISILESGYTVAFSDVTYRFYKNYIVVRERVRFPSSVEGEFWMGGWHVDQDDGDANGVFDRVYMDANSVNGYSYPYDLTSIEALDYADASQQGSIWSRFYVFNKSNHVGIGYVYGDLQSNGVTIESFDSYWINEGSSNDWTYYFYDSGSLDSDGSDTFWFYAMSGRKVRVIFSYHINDPYGWLDDANISATIYDPNGNVVPGMTYSSGKPAPQDEDVLFIFDATVTGWYHLTFNYDSADDLGWNDDYMSWGADMAYITSNYEDIYEDYFLWGNRFDINASAGGILELTYFIIPWYGYGEDWYNDIAGELSNPPSITVSSVIEQYHSQVRIRVMDDDGRPIRNAYVALNGSITYENYTDSTGVVDFRVVRDAYSCIIKVTSWGIVYVNNTTSITLSQDYADDKYVEYNFTMKIVKLNIRFFAADGITPLQGAKLKLTRASEGDVINLNSSLDGTASVYLRPGVWNVGYLEYAYPGSYYDNFSLLDAGTDEYIVDVHGDWVNNTDSADVNITCGQTWILIDHMAKDVKPSSKFEIYYGSPAQSVEWGECLEWLIKWADQYGKYVDLREGNETMGDYFSWELRYANNDSLVYDYRGRPIRRYYTPSNVSICINDTSSGPLYEIWINTTLLAADITYYIMVDGAINFLQKPQELFLFLEVECVPTMSTLDMPSDVYWNETLEISLRVWDSDGRPLDDVNAEVRIMDLHHNVIYDSMIPEVEPGIYKIEIECDFAPGKYSVEVSYWKKNYASGYLPSRDLLVLERPTTLELIGINPAPVEFYTNYIKVYWGRYSMTFSYRYVDDVILADVRGAEGSACLYKMGSGGNIPIANVEAVYVGNMSAYVFSINISDLNFGTYHLDIHFSKTNYEDGDVEITIIVEERPVSINLASDYVVGYYGNVISVSFYLEDLISRAPVVLSEDDLNVRVRDIESGLAVNVSIAMYTNGTCIIYYGETMPPSKYVTRIRISKPNYQEAVKEFYVEVLERPTYAGTNNKYLEVTWGDDVVSYFWYIDTLSSQPIEDAEARAYIKDSVGRIIFMTPLVLAHRQGSLAFMLKFNTSILRSGYTYDVIVSFNKTYWVAQDVVVKLHIAPIQVKPEYQRTMSVYKNPITGYAETEVKIRLYDVSPGHGGRIYKARNVRFVLYDSTGRSVAEGEVDYVDGVYVVRLDWSGLPVGSYTLEVEFELYNASFVEGSNKLSIRINVDYWGGTVDLFDGKYPAVIVIPMFIGGFLLLGVASYYAWVKIHIPWEVKYIDRLLKLLEAGVKEFEAVDRDMEIEDIARDLLE